jgi:long-subunit acyl-CoA synthetase (AMP-forming)/GNAT superfamily N-acetyltransferase
VDSDLVERVNDALAAFEKAAGPGPDLGAADGASTGALFRATREAVAALPSPAARTLVHGILDAAATRSVRLAFHASPFVTEWTDLLLEAVQRSDYTVGDMFLSRARRRGDDTLFLIPTRHGPDRLTWNDAGEFVSRIGRALLALREREGIEPVAMLSTNSPELALFDLACLSLGVQNVPIPANSPPAQIDFILEHSGSRSLFLGDAALAGAARDALGKRPGFRAYWLDPDRDAESPVRPLSDFLAAGESIPEERFVEAVARVRSSDLATTMYTSGTTGNPKGVPFTQGNLVTKRYARAAAWPDLGEGDRFLCYLPLYHTFGRWLEMLGCVFWGAVYAFVEDVSKEALVESFRMMRPTTFISVPKKWIDVAEAVAPLDDDATDDDALAARVREVTGGYLKRGLSAAGYLPASVFRRFHAAGIELHSGFGMTEATGGITMTPAGDYRDDSIGTALPGIELKIADDGELLIRGPYVTPPAEGESPRPEGWFATGDIVTEDAEGHLRIVDRKKEIFKNVQGETISPRRIESLFEDFDVVDRALVIGDRRDFCTALLVPTAELRERYAAGADGLTIDSTELWELFLPVVATVNRFLAPYERVLDYLVLARDLDAERGELTAKGTPKRALVDERFQGVIEPMYSREEVLRQVGEFRVTLPHWFFRQAGIPAGEVDADAAGLRVVTTGATLPIHREPGGWGVRVGDLVYDLGDDGTELRLGEILGRAELWLGNEAARRFGGPGIVHWWRRGRRARVKAKVLARPILPGAEAPAEEAPSDGPAPPLDLPALHVRAATLQHPDPEVRWAAVESMGRRLVNASPEVQSLAQYVLTSALGETELRAAALVALLPSYAPEDVQRVFSERLEDPEFLSAEEAALVARSALREDQLEALLERTTELAANGHPGVERLVTYLVQQAIEHGRSHLRIRAFLVRLRHEHPEALPGPLLEECLETLTATMRARLPRPETAAGVGWDDAVEFHGVTDESERTRILDAIANTKLLPEAISLLGGDLSPELRPLREKSVRVSFLGTGTGRAIHLLEWSPVGLESGPPLFECVLKVNRDLDWADIQAEIHILIRVRTGGRPVVKTQGGGHPEQGVWTEEWVPGRTLEEAADELIEVPSLESDTVGGRWQFVVSTCATLIVDFWKRTGQTLTLAKPTPEKIVVPMHDWQVGGRIVSVASRVECDSLTEVLESIHADLVQPLKRRFPEVKLGPSWPFLYSAAFEVLGVADAFTQLREEAEAIGEDEGRPVRDTTLRFLSSVRRRGFLPVRIRNAARRYRRWSQLNAGATLEARASTLDQIQEAYALIDLEREQPGTLAQFYRHTVFRKSEEELTQRFDRMIARHRASPLTTAEWHRDVAELRDTCELSGHEEFWLARMLYPHVEPRTRALLVREEEPRGGFHTGIEVEYEDHLGERFRIRRPVNPNEISALVRVFGAANFRRVPTTEHHDSLIATDVRGRVAGGIIFRRMSATYVRLEWIVVGRHRRSRGIGGALLSEFLQRMKAQGVQAVSTGFFRPAFFAAHGFGVDPRYAGLVRFLGDEAAGGSDGAERGR